MKNYSIENIPDLIRLIKMYDISVDEINEICKNTIGTGTMNVFSKKYTKQHYINWLEDYSHRLSEGLELPIFLNVGVPFKVADII